MNVYAKRDKTTAYLFMREMYEKNIFDGYCTMSTERLIRNRIQNRKFSRTFKSEGRRIKKYNARNNPDDDKISIRKRANNRKSNHTQQYHVNFS